MSHTRSEGSWHPPGRPRPVLAAAISCLAATVASCEPGEPPEEEDRSVAGCYELAEDPWSSERVPWTSRFRPPGDVPPRAFRIDVPPELAGSTPGRTPQRFAVTAEPGWPPLPAAITGGRAIGDSLAVWWTTGFNGVMLRLAPHGSALSGRAQAVTDEGRDSESVPVIYRRVACGELDFSPLDWPCDRSWCAEFR